MHFPRAKRTLSVTLTERTAAFRGHVYFYIDYLSGKESRVFLQRGQAIRITNTLPYAITSILHPVYSLVFEHRTDVHEQSWFDP